MGDELDQSNFDRTDSFLAKVARGPDVPFDSELTEQALVGRQLLQYQIVRRIGVGGMGQVYLANDHALGRQVAIKVLPASFTPEMKKRLLREGHASARIQHPAVATFYEAGEVDNLAFLAMAYVPGATLRERLADGPLSVEQSIAIASCILEALGHIHAAGLLHRDVKPENIIVTGERSAKLLDLGIASGARSEGAARAVEGTPNSSMTEVGAIVGSPAYMSPEQLNAGALDARSDLFSLGLVLRECLSGERLDRGVDAMAPVDVAEHATELNQVLARALATNRNQRYDSAGQFLRDLGTIGNRPATVDLPTSISILDFENKSGVEDDAWLAVAIGETVRSDLEQTKAIVVYPRLPPAKQATLPNRWVLGGSYERAGQHVHLAAELKFVPTDEVVATFERDTSDEVNVFALQDQLSMWVARALSLEPTSTRSSAKAKARELADRAQTISWAAGRAEMSEAIDLFAQAVEQDPNYAVAHRWLGQLLALSGVFTKLEKVQEKARFHLTRAIELDPSSGQAHVWCGYLAAYNQQAEASQWLARARELSPDDWMAHYFSGGALFATREETDALYRVEVGDPDGVDLHAWNQRRSIGFLQRAIELHPTNSYAHWLLGMAMLELDRGPEAIFCIETAVRYEPISVPTTAGCAVFLGEALRRLGYLEDARLACLDGLEAVESLDHMYRDTFRGVGLCSLGRTALAQGDREAARAAFEQARLHCEGRADSRSTGLLLIQALAGLAATTEDRTHATEAERLWTERPKRYSFIPIVAVTHGISLHEMARGFASAGDATKAKEFLDAALHEGATEASLLTARGGNPLRY